MRLITAKIDAQISINNSPH
ncbi:hypothetical protein ABFA07_000301 [Porites harrisoni]